MEPNHLEGEGFRPIVGWIPKSDRQVDLVEWYGLLPQHDVVERCPGRSDARLANAHGINRLGVHDVEAAASIHQHLSEPFHADDRVNHKRVPA